MSLRFDKSPAQLFRKVVLSLAIMIIVFGVNTGCSPKFKEAKTLFDQGYYGQAAVTFEEVSKRDKDKKIKDTAVFMAAESYRLNNDYDKAKKLYDKVLKKDPNNSQALLMRANMLKKMELYREAMDAYKKYLEVVPGDTAVEIKKAGCELALRWTPDSSLFKVEEFKAANTKANDWAPMIAAKKDNLVFFASDREGGFSKRIYGGTMQMWSDIWYVEGKESKVADSKKKSKKVSVVKWNKPVYAEKNSSKWNEGGLTFDDKFSTIYITQCGGEDGKTEKCAIYSYTKTGGVDWNLGEPLDICKEDTGHSYGHPAYGLGDNILYFSSDRLGGYGGFDIWAITYSKRSKNWGAPINLGPDINTSGNEYFPYFNKHDKRLYFSSDGWPTLGGLDINAAEVTNDITKWRDRENMREPLNSGGDDFGITFYEGKSTKGFFTSNRGKKNDDDIYAFDIVPLVITIRGVVTDCNTNKPLSGATVMISNDKDTSIMVLKANERGEYQATLNPKTNYELLAKYPELYYFEKPPVNRTTHGIRFSKELIQDFCMENPLDKIYTLPIFYDLDSANIRPDAARILDTFAQEVLIRYPRLIAELGSHTDCRASVEYNTKLAQRRADSAKVYLLRKYKIDTARIHAVGFGEKELINDCKCEGAEKAGFTPYRQDTTRKMLIVKDAKGNVIKSYYENYKPTELTKIDGKLFVPCDEYQHQQNRRTTVRFEWGNQKSRAKINQDIDANNSNKGAESKKKEEAAKSLATNPDLDLTNAIRLRIAMQDSVKMISIMIANKEAKAFAFDFKGKLTAVPSEVAAEWFEKDIIVKKNFVDGEKIKVGKVKLPSNKFIIEEMMVGDYLVKGVQFTVSDKVTVPTLGKSFFGKTFKEDSFISGSELVLIPKKAPKKPKAKKEEKKDGEETAPAPTENK